MSTPLSRSSNTWAEINLDQLKQNIEVLRATLPAGTAIAPVIKANAYGHGAVVVARELESMSIPCACVAAPSEALELREHGIRMPVLVMGYTPNDWLSTAVRHNITLTVFEEDQARLLSQAAVAQNASGSVHIKIDTGFHRLGKQPSQEFAEELIRISKLPALTIEGLFTHLRLASRETDDEQFRRFTEFADKLAQMGLTVRYRHVSDSIAAIGYPEFALDMVRGGAIIYGYLPRYQAGAVDVRPIMTVKSRVTRVQAVPAGDGVGYDEEFVASANTIVATVSVGYADGYPRHLSRKAEVMVRGQRARVIGLICMDQMMIDVSHIVDVKPGDEVILYGPEQGTPCANELAVLAGTNRNEILSSLSRRVPRIYRKSGKVVETTDYLSRTNADVNLS